MTAARAEWEGAARAELAGVGRTERMSAARTDCTHELLESGVDVACVRVYVREWRYVPV